MEAEFTSMEAAAYITIGLLNARSVCNKALLIRDLIIDIGLHVHALTEIWNPSNCTIAELLPPGYEIVHKPRQDKRGGGVAVLARTELRCKLKIALALTSFEAIIVIITSGHNVIYMCVVYAPECKQSSAQAHNTFISEFAPSLVDHLGKSLNVLLLGDFNYHVNAEANVYTNKFLSLPECFGLKTHVQIETHIKCNTFDLVITRGNKLLTLDITTDTSVTSDHVAVLFGIPAPKPLSENNTTKYSRWKSLDLDAFKSDLSMSDIHLILESKSMSDAVRTYDTILHDLIDKHAPEYDRTFKPRHNTPRYNSTVRDTKRLRRKLERRWRKSRSEPDWEAYRYQCQVVRDELVKTKSDHYHSKLSEADSHKDVYSIANSLLFGPKMQKLPTHDSVQDLSEQFADYFIQKIVTIRNGLYQNINTDNQCDETDVISILGSLNPATNEEISKIIRSSASKSCDLDPIPT